MKTTLKSVATAAALIAGMSLANAASQTETGVIKSIDAKANTITLQSGPVTTFWLASNLHLDALKLKVGEKVSITYDMMGNKATASAVVPAA